MDDRYNDKYENNNFQFSTFNFQFSIFNNLYMSKLPLIKNLLVPEKRM